MSNPSWQGRRRSRGLRLHLAAFALILLLPALGIGGVAAWLAVQDYRDAFRASLQDTARALRLAIDSELDTVQATLLTLAAAPDLPSPDAPSAAFNGFRAQLSLVAATVGHEIMLLAPDGRYLADSALPLGAALPRSMRMEDLRRSLLAQQPVASDLMPSPDRDRPVAAMIVPVVRGGEAVMAFAARLDPQALSRVLEAQELGEGRFATLVDGHGRIVARSRDGTSFLGRTIPAWFGPDTAGQPRGLVMGPSAEGTRALFGFERLQTAPGWTLVVAAPRAHYLAAWQRPLRFLLLGGALLLGLAAVLAYGLSRRLQRPVEALVEAARNVASGGRGVGGIAAGAPGPTGILEFDRLRDGLAAAEAAIGAGEERLALASGAAALGVWDFDPRSGVAVMNDECRGIYGLPPGRFTLDIAAWASLVHPEDRDGVLVRAGAAVREAAEYEDEFRILRADTGALRWVANRGRAMAGGARIVGIVRDVTGRRQDEEALRGSEERQRRILDNLLAFVGVLEPDGTLLEVGTAPLRAAGIGIGEVRGRKFWDCPWWTHDPGLQARLRDACGRAAAGETVRLDAVARLAGEARMPIDLQIAPLRDAEGRITQLIPSAMDLTARIAAEAALAENEARFRAMADNIPQLAWMARPEGWIFWFNRRWHDYTGTSLEEAQGTGWHALLHPEHAERVAARIGDAWAGGEPWEDLFPLRGRDGGWRWFLSRAEPIRDAAGRITLWFGTNTDITEQREAEERYRALVEVSPQVVWMGDGEGRITYINPYWYEYTGMTPEESADGGWLRAIHPEDRARAADAFQAAQAAAAAGRDGGYAVEFRYRHGADGAWRWFLAKGVPVRDAEGRVERWVSVALDIHDRREAEERRELLAREVDHRAKNVLAVVQSVLRLTRTDDPRRFAEAVEGRVAALARAHALLAEGRWRGASLQALAEEELAVYSVGARTPQRRYSLSGPPVQLRAEAVQPMSMVLHELATNAAKYGALSLPGGQVAVSWTVAQGTSGHLVIEWEETGGPPILAPPDRQGFGSRLIAATVQRQLGGRVQLAWEPGGLRCTLTIGAAHLLEAPGAPPGPPRAGAPAAQGGGAVLRGRRILVAEDEALVALELRDTLEALGCRVVGPAAGFEEAMRLAERESRDRGLDAAVLDVNLGGHASFPVADLLAGRGVPVVFATGYGELPGGSPASGTARLLRKPFGRGEIEDALRDLLGEHPPEAAGPRGTGGIAG